MIDWLNHEPYLRQPHIAARAEQLLDEMVHDEVHQLTPATVQRSSR